MSKMRSCVLQGIEVDPNGQKNQARFAVQIDNKVFSSLFSSCCWRNVPGYPVYRVPRAPGYGYPAQGS
eukprot:872434-Rhodomonas_salina.1